MIEFLSKFWLLIWVVWLFILLLAAFNFAEIAKTKGHSYGKYFAWCFFTGLIGWIMVIALPERTDEVQTDLAEAEKAETIKVVRVLIITAIVIAMIVWIGVSVNSARQKEQEDKMRIIQYYEDMIDMCQNGLDELSRVSPRNRDSKWEERHEVLQQGLRDYKKELKKLKEEN